MPGRFCGCGVLAAVLAAAGAGCGDQRRPVKVEGTVILDGKPLARATVYFGPIGDEGQVATALAGSDGVFRLTTINSGDGAVPGDYKVVVTISEPPPDIEAAEGMTFAEMMAQYQKAMMARRKNPPKPPPTIPEVYTNETTTPLRQRVPPDGPVIIELRSTGGS